MTIIDKACWERGCACYDSRLDSDGVEVVAKKEWVGLTDEKQLIQMALEALEIAADGGGVNFYEYAKELRQYLEQQPVSPELATLIDENQRLRAELKFNGSEPADTVDWKDMYQKEKRKSEMWVAKYEKDIGSLEKASPMQQQDVPVAWWNKTKDTVSTDPVHRHNSDCEPLYTRPPQRKPLTDEEIETYRYMIDWTAHWSYINFARAIEAAHGIKE